MSGVRAEHVSELLVAVAFFALVLFGFWCLMGGPARPRTSVAPLSLRPRSASGLGRMMAALGLGLLWVLSAVMSVLAWWLRRFVTERRARRLAKGGSFKTKH